MLGDSIRRSIDAAISKSEYGVVILSPSFSAKDWTQRELDALITKEAASDKVVLAVWHDLTREDIARFSPLLADRLAADTSKGMSAVVDQVSAVLGTPGKRSANCSLSPPDRVIVFEQIIDAFNPARTEGLAALPPASRDLLEARFRAQEQALRRICSVDRIGRIKRRERNEILNILTPFVDPSLQAAFQDGRTPESELLML